jgi:hypothetical protein
VLAPDEVKWPASHSGRSTPKELAPAPWEVGSSPAIVETDSYTSGCVSCSGRGYSCIDGALPAVGQTVVCVCVCVCVC